MTPPALPRLWPLVLLLLSGPMIAAAPTVGGTVYTKRVETNLLAEPAPLAAVTAKVAFGRALTVQAARGPWLRVRDGGGGGWVFAGNISETKPAEGKGVDGLGLTASQTSATAAARPLTPAAADYATRRNLTNARDDLDWLLMECHTVTPDDVENFLRTQKKGEYQ